MTRKSKIILLSSLAFLVFASVLTIALIKLNKKSEVVPEYVFLYAENQTKDYPTTLGGQYFADLVYERTGGKIKILIKYESEMGSEGEAIDQVKYGGVAFARVSLSQLAEKIPDMTLLMLPYMYDDSAHMWRVLEGEIGDEFLQKADEYDLVGLSWYDAGARNFYSSSAPIRRLEDLQGMTIRAQESEIMSDMVSALGANPVKVVYSEVYSAIETGLVDGAENNWPSYESMKHYKVAKYYTVDEHARVPEMQICSKAVWDSLSDEYKEIISECAKESAVYERKLWKEREESSKQIAVENGTEVIELSTEEKRRFRAAMTELYEKYAGDNLSLVQKIIDY
ncbi:MAG: TRAP transporter substrate-binding protein [Lachnospiraceae bacterium]|nr:TRAP transporter substrate-binding protein [Lachnospiraceae bacterium]